MSDHKEILSGPALTMAMGDPSGFLGQAMTANGGIQALDNTYAMLKTGPSTPDAPSGKPQKFTI